MKQYEKYKASGVEWLGDIPEHWAVNKISRAFNDIGSGTTPSTNEPSYYSNAEINWLNTGDLNDGFITDTSKKISQKAFNDHSALRIYGKESVVIAMYGATIGKLGYLDIETTTNQACCVINDSPKVSQRYLFYYLLSNKEHIISLAYGGGQPNISQDVIKRLAIVQPSLAEQGAIVRYLDYVVGRVDEVIGQKGELIERLQAKRKALINEVVTRGLAPTVPTRSSGIDWLGNIPAHWKIGKLKHFSSKIGSGVTPTGGAEVYQSEGVLFIRSQNVYSDGLRIDEVAYISDDIDAAMSNSRVADNDVLLNITGASIGRCCYVKNIGRANVNQHVCIIRPVDENLMCEYLQFVLNSDIGQIQIALAQNGGNREGLNFENLKNFIIPDISLAEQKEIVTFIEERTTKIDNLVGELQGQIERLRQYKIAIIAEAVTGKIDVREWQQPTNN